MHPDGLPIIRLLMPSEPVAAFADAGASTVTRPASAAAPIKPAVRNIESPPCSFLPDPSSVQGRFWHAGRAPDNVCRFATVVYPGGPVSHAIAADLRPC